MLALSALSPRSANPRGCDHPLPAELFCLLRFSFFSQSRVQLKHYEQLLPRHCCKLATRHFMQLAMSWERHETTHRNSGIAVMNKSRPPRQAAFSLVFCFLLGRLVSENIEVGSSNNWKTSYRSLSLGRSVTVIYENRRNDSSLESRSLLRSLTNFQCFTCLSLFCM